jgi:hypothetical protein
MKRTFHLLGQAVPLVLLWAAIVEIGFRMQQSFGPLVANTVAKVENRRTPKISPKSNLRCFHCCKAL